MLQLFKIATRPSFLPSSISFASKFRISSSQDIVQRRQKESQIAETLKQQLNASFVKVDDTSVNGSECGQMYKLIVQSPLFNEKSRVEQHQMVNFALGDLFKNVHGYNLKTLIQQHQQQSQTL